MKEDRLTVTTQLTVTQLKRLLNEVCDKLKVAPEPIAYGPLDIPEDVSEIGVLLERPIGFGKSAWAVQIRVFDHGERRDVILIAFGYTVFEIVSASLARENGIIDFGQSKRRQKKIAGWIAQGAVG